MKQNIILYLSLSCVLMNFLWKNIVIESFDYQKDCTDELADSIAVKRKKEQQYKLDQMVEAKEGVVNALNDIGGSFANNRGYITQAYFKEDMHQKLLNSVIDNSSNTNETDKLSTAQGNLITLLSRYETLLNDGDLEKLADYQT